MTPETELRPVTHPMIDGFTDEFLEVLAGPDGAGGAPHYYEIRAKVEGEPVVLLKLFLQEGNPTDQAIGLNGIGNQTLILIALDFLKKANQGPFACRETSVVITKLEEAMQWTKQREMDRKNRGVYLQHKK